MQAMTDAFVSFCKDLNVPTEYIAPTVAQTKLPAGQDGGYFYTYRDTHFGLEAPTPILFACATSLAYVTLVFVLWPMIRPSAGTTAYSIWKSLRFYHNVVLSLYSTLCWTATLYYMYHAGELNWFGTDGLQPMLCNDSIPQWVWLLNLTFIASKIYEWFDTMFLVLLKPQVPKSFLHCYHHSTTFWLMLMVTNFPSTIKMGMVLNGFVHTLMYWHYAKPFPAVVVPFITFSQILQLAFLTFVWHVTPDRCPQHAGFPSKYPLEFATPYLMVPVYLIFFVHFFVKRFIIGGSKKKSGGKKELASPVASPLLTKEGKKEKAN